MSNIDKLRPGIYAILFRNNWDGEGDTYEAFASLDAEGVWRNEDGDELLEYQGDEVLKAWPLDDGSDVLALLDELEAKDRSWAAQDDHINQQADRIESLEKKNGDLGRALGAAEKRIAELEALARGVKQFSEFQICHYGATEDYAKGYIDCQNNYNKVLFATAGKGEAS
ncbi:TPA: hypothetical protein ACXNLO_001393 [Enterobacter cloacae]